MMKFAVSIVDDHALFRRGVADIIRQSNQFLLHKEYACGRDFLVELDENRSDLLLLDVQMPEITGIDVLQQIRKSNHDLKVIMLTASVADEIILDAIRYGANGFLPKDTLPDEILNQLKHVINGKTILHADGIDVLADQFRQQNIQATAQQQKSITTIQQQQKLLAEITLREQETLRLIAQGLNNKLIARQLGISDGTVKVYVKNLLRKLNVHSRLELSVWVHRHLHTADFDLYLADKKTF
ncbi:MULTISPECIES: response regulator [unclassified Acinetobacter]|uniref:response regulator n=1 Tax=unclassified Acinetobacter TaxID=196816 RepID=UPI0029348571|nr:MULTISPECIES: response regulator [unclassified Acinetobacter]WOE32459.1 response regulator [Acinetobacter sp. SAAs470]WOE37934.1 response regulator [Acinetobacter sp. SAAs474]